MIRVVLALMLSFFALAEDSKEYIFGSITYHIMDPDGVSSNYTNKLSSDGRLISNLLLGMQYVREDDRFYDTLAVFGGQDSVGKPMAGFKYSAGLIDGVLYMGIAIGAYVQNDRDYEAVGVHPVSVDIHGTGVVPILGVELNYKIPLNKQVYIKFNNIFTPILTNSCLSIGSTF